MKGLCVLSGAAIAAGSVCLVACAGTSQGGATSGSSAAGSATSGMSSASGASAGATAPASGAVTGSSGVTTGISGSVAASGTTSGSSVGGTGSTASAGEGGSTATTEGGDDASTDASFSASGDAGPHAQFICPPGPYPAQTMGPATSICDSGGFTYNYAYNEGPTWIASQNAFFFSNFVQGDNVPNKMSGDIIKYPLGGTCEVWLHDVGCNGLGVSATGTLLAACHGPRAVMEYDPVTKAGHAVATMAAGQMLDAPNDLIAHSNGTIFFSNTEYELGGRTQGLGTALVRIDPTGTTSILRGNPNGVALSPDESKLYVVGMGVWNLDANAVIGTKTNDPTPGGDGISVDCAGHILNVGTNSAFGGPDGKTLIAVGGGTKAVTYSMTVPGFP